jgi:hypothetical protein
MAGEDYAEMLRRAGLLPPSPGATLAAAAPPAAAPYVSPLEGRPTLPAPDEGVSSPMGRSGGEVLDKLIGAGILRPGAAAPIAALPTPPPAPATPAEPFPPAAAALVNANYLGIPNALGITHAQSPTEAPAAAGPHGIAPGDVQTLGGAPAAAPAAAARPAMGGGGGGGMAAAPAPREIDLLTPTQRREYEQGVSMQRDAVAQGAERTGEELQSQQAMAYQQERDMQAQDAGRQRAEIERQEELRRRAGEIDDAVQEASKFRVDPSRATKGEAGFASAIGLVLMAFGGKLDQGVEMLNKKIDRDIDAQRFEYQQKKDKIGGAQNAYANAMSRFGDARAAELVTRRALGEQYGLQMQRAAMSLKSADAETAAQQMTAQIQAKYADDTLRFLKAAPTGGGAPTMKLPELDEKQLVRDPISGQTYYVAEGNETRKKMNAVADIDANLSEAIRLRQNASPVELLNPLSTVRQRLKALQADTATKSTVHEGQGAMSQGDKAVRDAAIGSMTGLLGSNTKTIESYQAQMRAEAQRNLVSQNAMPVAVVTVVNPKTGIPERKVIPSGQTYQGAAPRPGMPGSTTPIGASK